MYTFLVAQAAIHRVLEGLNLPRSGSLSPSNSKGTISTVRCDDQSAVSHGETYTVKDDYSRF